MPGTGYNCDRPLLYWSAMALIDAGWRIDRLDLAGRHVPMPRVRDTLSGVVERWVRRNHRECGAAPLPEARPDLMIVAKSLSTLVYPHAAELGLKCALLTPVLRPADFDPTDTVIPVPLNMPSGESGRSSAPDGSVPGSHPAPLILAGTADGLFDERRARTLTSQVHTYEGANHSIEVPGDWRRSLGYLADVVNRVVAYAG